MKGLNVNTDEDGLFLVIGLGLAALFAGTVVAHRKTDFDALFESEGRKWNVDPDLLRALARHESNLNPAAVGKANRNGTRDYGLMQINNVTAKAYGVTDVKRLLDPALSVELAAHLLSDIRRELGKIWNPYTWVAAYNAGSPAIKRRGIFNTDYVAKVMYHWQLFKVGRKI